MRQVLSGQGAIRLVIATITTMFLTLPLPSQTRDNPQPIDGIYHLSNESCSDGKTDPCFFYVELRGDTAKALYMNMRSKPQDDECSGGKMKTDNNNLFCFANDPDDHVCWFGYDFAC